EIIRNLIPEHLTIFVDLCIKNKLHINLTTGIVSWRMLTLPKEKDLEICPLMSLWRWAKSY
ncbi:MAG: hypothetical protein V1721_03905, partial [Pseudomonadota bacterium]